MSEANDSVARVLRGIKAEQKLSVRVIVERTGIPTTTVNRMLSGQRDIKITQLFKLAECFGVELADVFRKAAG